jgi:effector-binding domain-containing protein
MTLYDVQTLTVPEMTVASVHLFIPTNDQAEAIITPAFDHLFGSLAEQRITPRGPCLTVWKSTPDMFTDEVLDAAVPISADAVLGGDLVKKTLPSQLVATATHRGEFSEFLICHTLLKEWMVANEFRLGGCYREIYHASGLESVTEVQYPIERMP